MKNRILVWDWPTRVFHWSLALSFLGAYVTSEMDDYRAVHMVFGYLLAGLVGFRLIWGVWGSRHARFSSFVRAPAAVLTYLRSLLRPEPEHHVGHNPAGAVAIILMLGLGVATAFLGWATYSDLGGEWAEDLHEGLANVMLAVVLVHILGVIVSSFLHRENLPVAMLSGYKNAENEAPIASGHSVMAVVLVAAMAWFAWALWQGKLPILLDPTVVAARAESGTHHHQQDKDDD